MTDVLPQRPPSSSAKLATEQEAREVAEAARETEWQAPSFVRQLFDGRFRLDLIHPYPQQTPEELAKAKPFLERLERFMQEKVDSDAIDAAGKIPQDVIDGLRDIGAFGIKISEEYGGLGLSQTSYTHAIGLVTSQDGSLTALLSASQSIGVPVPLKLFGTPEQKKKYLPRCAKGAVSAFALTEDNVGSDPAAMSTVATLSDDGTHYILNGEKLWCTNGTIAEFIVVMAITGKRKITAFIVETAWEGVDNSQRLDFMGLNAIENGIIRFTNVKVPVENRLGAEGEGWQVVMGALANERSGISESTGKERELEALKELARNSRKNGRPVLEDASVRRQIARFEKLYLVRSIT